jgi:hypothetical protein
LEWRDPITDFNDRLAPLAGAAARTIEPGDASINMLPRAPMGTFSPGWLDLNRMLTLLANDGAKDTPRWKNEMEKLISTVSDWNEDDGSGPEFEDRFFLEKANLLQSILNLEAAQASAFAAAKTQAEYDKLKSEPRADILGRGRAQDAFVALLEGKLAHAVYNRRRIIWYSAISEVIRQYDKSEEPASILTRFTNSRDPVLVMYGKVYKTLDTQ